MTATVTALEQTIVKLASVTLIMATPAAHREAVWDRIRQVRHALVEGSVTAAEAIDELVEYIHRGVLHNEWPVKGSRP